MSYNNTDDIKGAVALLSKYGFLVANLWREEDISTRLLVLALEDKYPAFTEAWKDSSVSLDDCTAAIVKQIEANHDCNVGINWDVIDNAIDEYITTNYTD